MAEFKLSGDLYVSKSGSNANNGLTPATSKLTVQGALDVASEGNDIIIGDGVYEEFNLTGGSVNLIADGVVYFIGDNSGTLIFDGSINMTACIVYAYGIACRPKNRIHSDCFFINCVNIGNVGGVGANTYNRCRFINSGARTEVDQEFNYCIFEGSSELTFLRQGFVKNSQISSTVTLSMDDEQVALDSTFCNVEGIITINSVTYNNITDAQFANPLFFQNSTNSPSMLNRLLGEMITMDMSVSGTSALLGAGQNGTNIGGVRRGLPQARNYTSIFGGVNSNIVFDGNKWLVKSGETTGNITSKVIDFGLTVKSPILKLKGIVNFLDNVPDFDNALTNPNKLDIECRWAIIGEDITMKPWKTFLINERMLLDASNKSNGETGFDWNDTVIIPMKEIQLRITLRQNYNPA